MEVALVTEDPLLNEIVEIHLPAMIRPPIGKETHEIIEKVFQDGENDSIMVPNVG